MNVFSSQVTLGTTRAKLVPSRDGRSLLLVSISTAWIGDSTVTTGNGYHFRQSLGDVPLVLENFSGELWGVVDGGSGTPIAFIMEVF